MRILGRALMGATDKPAISLSSVQRYIRLCGRVFLARARQDELVDELTHAAQALTPDEWHLLYADASAQGMAPMVYQMSANSGALAFAPETFAAIFTSSYPRSLVNLRRIERQLEEMLRVFAEQQLDILVLKGPPLVRRLYSDPALRPISDLDLLARPGDLQRVCSALISLGYRAVPGYGGPRDFHALRGYTLIYRRGDEPLVELHWRPVSLASYQRSFLPDVLWRRSLPTRIGGENAHLLNPEDELRYLCVHYAAEHRGKRLIWLIDIARLLQSLPENWGWEQFTTTTIALGVATPILSALDDCQTMLGLDVSDAPVANLRAATASPAEKRAWALAQATFYQPRRLLAHARTLETPQERMILARGALAWYVTEGRTWALRRLKLAPNRLFAHWR
jgi:putative nucleotidyltransferase-like protein